MPTSTEITALADRLITSAERDNHRRAMVMAGDRSWCVASAEAALAARDFDRVLWLTNEPPQGVWSMEAARADTVLGRELDAVVFDAHAGFHPDAFGAISGTLRGGGVLIILAPAMTVWPHFDDPDHRRLVVPPYSPEDVAGRFLERLVRIIGAHEAATVVEQGRACPSASLQAPVTTSPKAEAGPVDEWGTRTHDQRQAVEAIVRVITGRRRRPVVLTSDRGRGKSAALGIAAARLLIKGLEQIVVTGPRLDAVERAFEHAHRLLPDAKGARASVQWNGAHMSFVPPDELVHGAHPAELVLVDEAAAIPTPLLERLLRHYSRIVFATTVHGYEGTGRGFSVRFQSILDARTPSWRNLRLETPIRWAPRDPLEDFVFQALLLNAAAASDTDLAGVALDEAVTEKLDRDQLVADETTLSALFGLLVLAHYRTRPFDLRLLLDGPNISVYATRAQGHVIGTVLMAREGALDEDMARGIWAGKTRPHGHLIPESLAAHVGLEQAPLAVGARVMRIAVHPAVQGRGLGTEIVRLLSQQAERDGADYIGASFGATAELLRFWERAGFTVVRLSVTRGSATGAHSVIVLRAISERGARLVHDARERFIRQLPHQLGDPVRDLEPELAALLLRGEEPSQSPALSHQDWRDVAAFAYGARPYEVCLAPLWDLCVTGLSDPRARALLSTNERDALILKILQRWGWKETAQHLGVAGRADVIGFLKSAVRSLVGHYGDEGLHDEIRWFLTS